MSMRRQRADSDEEWQPLPATRRVGGHAKKKTTADAQPQSTASSSGPFVMSHQRLRQMQVELNLTSRQMRGIQRYYNAAAPSGVIMHEPHYRDVNVQWNKLLLHQFTVIRVKHPTNDTHFRAVFPTEVESLLVQLAEIHGREIRRVHIGCDAGRGFLKVVATIQWKSDNETYDIGDHSRRRVIVLAILPLMHESYSLLHDVFQRINFPVSMDFVFIGDLKVLNICLGLSTNAASNPCPFCDQIITATISLNKQLSSGKSRTFRSIAENAAKYEQKTALVDVASCINSPLPLFRRNPDAKIDTVVGHPGVHYLLSANWIITKLETLRPQVSEWYKVYHYVRPSYFSGEFEGNQIYFLLKKQQLQQLHELLDDVQPVSEQPITEWGGSRSRHSAVSDVELYFDVLVAFSAVAAGCFGKKLRPMWESSIQQFRETLLRLNLSRLPCKFHIICCHIRQWCLDHNAGLATVTDQWCESIHADWRRLWERSYLVKDVDCDQFGQQLLRCTAALNALHTPVNSQAVAE